jgi:hypothetical protein
MMRCGLDMASCSSLGGKKTLIQEWLRLSPSIQCVHTYMVARNMVPRCFVSAKVFSASFMVCSKLVVPGFGFSGCTQHEFEGKHVCKGQSVQRTSAVAMLSLPKPRSTWPNRIMCSSRNEAMAFRFRKSTNMPMAHASPKPHAIIPSTCIYTSTMT